MKNIQAYEAMNRDLHNAVGENKEIDDRISGCKNDLTESKRPTLLYFLGLENMQELGKIFWFLLLFSLRKLEHESKTGKTSEEVFIDPWECKKPN